MYILLILLSRQVLYHMYTYNSLNENQVVIKIEVISVYNLLHSVTIVQYTKSIIGKVSCLNKVHLLGELRF